MRARLVGKIAARGAVTTGELARLAELPLAVVSHHLGVLKTNELVEREPVGREAEWRLAADVVAIIDHLYAWAEAQDEGTADDDDNP